MTDHHDALDPTERLHAAVEELRAAGPPHPGLPARTAARARQIQTRRWIGGSSGVLAVLTVTALLSHQTAPRPGEITFAVRAPADAGVSLVGDFNEWETDRVRLTPKGKDRWEVTLRLPPGRYRFAYVTDGGEWLPDAEAAPVLDDFGRPTSVLTVASR
ncbi:MAG TPA: isoamylase early set domain-containing protein [Gemmatimonadales bacterium]|nr:isoamylase early set domain-containing protein [Gemmatimonadales bacterium]